jgi:hypothetical protein
MSAVAPSKLEPAPKGVVRFGADAEINKASWRVNQKGFLFGAGV